MIKLNGQKINITLFSDNTSQVWKIENIDQKRNEIEWQFDTESEFMHLAQLVNLIHREAPMSFVSLKMDCLPYARQDKLISNETTFALQSFAFLLNNLQLDRVESIDTHSNIPDYLIRNFHNIFPYQVIEKIVAKVNPDVLCFPDKGARDRYTKELAFLGKVHTYGEKVRDQATGHITSYELKGDVKDSNVLIVDDICDGGMTFILLAKQLLTNGAKSVNLYTTHGIYSKGLRPLREAQIDRIFNMNGEVDETRMGNLIYEKII